MAGRGEASSEDILQFAKDIRKGVLDTFGVLLKPEPVFVGFHEDPLAGC